VATKVIYGPPGTGKTRSLVEMATKCRTKNNKILFVAFTKAAAEEINGRMSGSPAMTLHSFCYRQLNMNSSQVVDRAKLIEFARTVNVPLAGGGIFDMQAKMGDTYLSIMSFANNRLMPMPEAYDALGRPGSPSQFEMFVTAYEKWKHTYGYVDFDDMLSMWFNQNVAPPAYDVIFLDEAQDLTRAQWMVFFKLIEKTQEVVIAGDDDQAIFQWMGAIPEGMPDFAIKMDADVTVLSQSYRVPTSVFKVADYVVRQISDRVPKAYTARNEPGSVEHVLDREWILRKLHHDRRALWLFRDRFKMLDAQYTLNDEMIPYSVSGGFSPWTSVYAGHARKRRFADIPEKHWSFYDAAVESGALDQPIELELSTVHKAKGREHDRVIFSVEGSGRALENMYEDPDAELRVLYVGITRARRELWLHGHHPAFSHE
jgi:superfamily I DNA/RNA helicase